MVTADVYSVTPHTGRGGWSWYTGSAGWMYRLVLESLLGVRLEHTHEGAFLHITPCLPAEWPGFTMEYRYRETIYRLRITQDEASVIDTEVTLDGVVQEGRRVPLSDDGKVHEVRVRLVAPQAEAAPIGGSSMEQPVSERIAPSPRAT